MGAAVVGCGGRLGGQIPKPCLRRERRLQLVDDAPGDAVVGGEACEIEDGERVGRVVQRRQADRRFGLQQARCVARSPHEHGGAGSDKDQAPIRRAHEVAQQRSLRVVDQRDLRIRVLREEFFEDVARDELVVVVEPRQVRKRSRVNHHLHLRVQSPDQIAAGFEGVVERAPKARAVEILGLLDRVQRADAEAEPAVASGRSMLSAMASVPIAATSSAHTPCAALRALPLVGSSAPCAGAASQIAT